MESLWSIGLAVLAGASAVVQQALNAHLRVTNSAAWSGFVSYVGGAVFMLVFALALRDPAPFGATFARTSWWEWTGGLFGAVFIGASIILVPRLGTMTLLALLIAGQMVTSLLFDHFGLLGVPQHPISLTRLLGAALLVGGVVLIRL